MLSLLDFLSLFLLPCQPPRFCSLLTSCHCSFLYQIRAHTLTHSHINTHSHSHTHTYTHTHTHTHAHSGELRRIFLAWSSKEFWRKWGKILNLQFLILYRNRTFMKIQILHDTVCYFNSHSTLIQKKSTLILIILYSIWCCTNYAILLHCCPTSPFHLRFHLVDEPEPVSVSAVRAGTYTLILPCLFKWLDVFWCAILSS